jgi:hypothetical protein
VNYIENNGRLHSIDRVYEPEPLAGAMVCYERGIWFDARGEYSRAAFFSEGCGYCDSTCEFGVRVEYRIDEGFGRIRHVDRVFFLTGDYRVTGDFPTELIRFTGVSAADAGLKEAEDFLSGKIDPGLGDIEFPPPQAKQKGNLYRATQDD